MLSYPVLRCFAPLIIINELHYTTNSSIRDNLRPVLSLLWLIRHLTISWQCLRRWAVNDLAASFSKTLPTKGRFSACVLLPAWLDLNSGFCDYACLMSLNKNETGHRLSRILVLVVVWWSFLIIFLIKKT